MHWTQIPLGPLQTNAYVIWNDHKEALIFDPGGPEQSFIQWLDDNQLKPQAILLTHAHFDHIGGVDLVRRNYSCPVYIHEAEQDWLLDPNKNRSSLFSSDLNIVTTPAEHIIRNEGIITVGSFTVKVLETPGHSPGSVSYLFEDDGIIFSGDVLFAQGVGRTDLPGGSYEQISKSIHHKLFELPEETIVACGHGPTSTIARIMNENPYISGFNL